MLSLPLANHETTQALGFFIGERMQAGDSVAARGDLGAGKTCLAQGVASGLGVPADHYVNSPTFSILQIHPGRVPFFHMDLYRIGDEEELLGLGLDECFEGTGVAYVEWPDRVPGLLPKDALAIELEIRGASRIIHLRSEGGDPCRLLELLCKDAHLFQSPVDNE